MPKISVPTKSLQGVAPLQPGIYDFVVKGFKPTKSKKGDSINLNPDLRVINHPELNDSRIMENLNTKAGWIHQEFVHALGLEMEEDPSGSSNMPGEFAGSDNDPDNWQYHGPIVGRTGRCEVVRIPNNKGGEFSAVKRYLCQVSGCNTKHQESLV